MRRICLSTFLILAACVLAFSQGRTTSNSADKPIVLGTEADGYPTEIQIKGVIVDLDFSEVKCGDILTAGTVKIRLTNKVENYRSKYVYLVVVCAQNVSGENYVGKSIEIKGSKFMKNQSPEIASFSNRFDSTGVPFYVSEGGGLGGLKRFLR